MISDLSNSGSMAALEAMLRFSAQRQRLIAANIANISTPGYLMKDVSVADFQRSLGEAVDRRRSATDGSRSAALELRDTSEVRQNGEQIELTPVPVHQGVLFHDRNNRDIERLMQSNVENAMVYRVATELLRSRYDSIRTAISERV